MFSAPELRRLVQHNFGESVANSLPGSHISATELAATTAEVLQNRGLIGPALFAAIRTERPNRASEVDTLEAEWARPPTLHEAAQHALRSPEESFHWLGDAELRVVITAALDAGLAAHLDALTAGIPPTYVATITIAGMANARLITMLKMMNRVRCLRDGSVPLDRWLDNASMLTLGQQVEQTFNQARNKIQVVRTANIDST